MPLLVQDPRQTVDAAIQSGQSLSATLEIAGYRVAGIVMPATWDAAALTVQGSHDGSTFQNVYDGDGSELTIQAAASRNLTLTSVQTLALLAWKQIKIRSGTSGTPVNQTGARTLTVVLVPA